MDETLTRVAIDVSGRPYLVWKVAFSKPKLGEMDTELFREWFQAFAQNAGITLHVENLYGENNHHIAETCFKGLARALRGRDRSTRARPAACPRPRARSPAESQSTSRSEDRRWSSITVHEPPNVSANRLESAEQLVFVKDGYTWLAALVPPLWLLWKRMWLELAIYRRRHAACSSGLLDRARRHEPRQRAAADRPDRVRLRGRRALQRRARAPRLAPVGTVSRPQRRGCERRFLESWLPSAPRSRSAVGSVGPRSPRRDLGEAALAQAKDALARGRRVFAEGLRRNAARRHHRLRLGQPALGGQGLRARGARERGRRAASP